MSVSPDDKMVAATSEATSMAHLINTETYEVTANILVDTRPRVAIFTADGKEVWVSAEVGGTVAVIDPKTAKITKKFGFQIPGIRPELIQPMGIIFSKDGKTAFVAIGRANRIAVVDTATYEVKDYVLTGQRPWHMSLSADGSKLFTANGLTNDMTVIDVASLKAEKSVPVGRLPWGVVVSP
jgi:PQQ-dependent catabolism-associated beta-propeller protein